MAKKDSLIQYWLEDIKILKFTLSEIEGLDLKKDNIELVLNLTGGLNTDKNYVEVTTEVQIYKEGENNEDIAELKVKTVFAIQNADILNENGELYLPKNLLVAFNSISISTTRGILFTKFQGTSIDNFILPLVDPKKFSQEFLKATDVEIVD